MTQERITIRDITSVDVELKPVTTAMQSITPVSTFRHHDKLHVSDLIHKCDRFLALIRRFGLNPFPGRLWDTEDVCFTIGNAVHDLIIGRLKGASAQHLYGRWSCSCKSTEFIGVYADAKENVCNTCTLPTTEYNEITALSELHQLVGNVDLLMKFGDYFRVNELKSINKAGFEGVKSSNRAKPDHIVQVGIYWYLLRDLGYPLQDKVSVFYVQKDYKPGVIMHEVVIDAHEIERAVYAYLNAAPAIATRDVNAPLPDRANACSSFSSSAPRACHLAGLCFNISSNKELTKYENSSL